MISLKRNRYIFFLQGNIKSDLLTLFKHKTSMLFKLHLHHINLRNVGK